MFPFAFFFLSIWALQSSNGAGQIALGVTAFAAVLSTLRPPAVRETFSRWDGFSRAAAEILLRLTLAPILRFRYRISVRGLENIPASGPVILAPNHVTFIDAALLWLIAPRRLRFLGFAGYAGRPGLRTLFRLFGVIPTDSGCARAAVRAALTALARDEAVVIFPEGMLTRDGHLCPLLGGVALIARRAGATVVPVYLDGLWGSVFSFRRARKGGASLRQLTRPVRINIGKPLTSDLSMDELKQSLIDLGEAAFRRNPEFEGHLASAVTRALAADPKRIAVVDCALGRREMSAGMVLALSLGLARRLRKEVPEKRVGLVLPPGLAGIIANLACVFADKVPVNINFTLGRSGIEASIRKSGLRTMLTVGVVREKITEKFPEFPWSPNVIDVREALMKLPKLRTLSALAAIRLLPARVLPRLFGLPERGGDAEAGLLFTSGSVGEPKGVVLTHRNILGNCRQVEQSGVIPADAVILANLPIFHSFGFTVTIWFALLNGIKAVTLPSPLDTRRCAEVVKAEQVTVLIGTPTFFRPYLKKVEPAELASVKFVVGGAEKTPIGFHKAWEDRFGSRYLEGYGLTETTPVVSANLPDHPERPGTRLGSVGRLFPGMAARIVDPDTGSIKPMGHTGLLQLKGVNVFPGYLDEPERTAQAFSGDWFVTGDLARLDDDGFIYIEGRISRFSKIGGEMVPHGTVEAEIVTALGLDAMETPAVAVTARKDPAKGEALVLLTTLPITLEELRKRLSDAGLPNLWIPRIIRRVPAIPMLASGKLDLRAIKTAAEESAEED